MTLDCYDFYLWTIGELTLPPRLGLDLMNEVQETADATQEQKEGMDK